VKSVYRNLAKPISLLLAWLGVGWICFPTIAFRVSKAVGQPFDMNKAGLIAYPLSASCFVLSVLFIYFWYVTLPVEESYFEEKAKMRMYKCPFCGKKINVEEVHCPYCKMKIPK
jgi:hypothetical protein